MNTTIRIDRLEAIAEHLEKGELGHEYFDFSVYNAGSFDFKGCGTNGCAIGELPIIFPYDWYFSAGNGYGVESKSKVPPKLWLGLSKGQYYHLFTPGGQCTPMYGGKNLGNDAARYEVAANIRSFIELVKSGAI